MFKSLTFNLFIHLYNQDPNQDIKCFLRLGKCLCGQESLLCRHKGLSSNPQHSCKNQHWGSGPLNPKNYPGSQPSQNDENRERPCGKRYRHTHFCMLTNMCHKQGKKGRKGKERREGKNEGGREGRRGGKEKNGKKKKLNLS